MALIYPIQMLAKCHKTEYHLILAHLCRNPIYRDFYRTVPGYKILDNGAAEGALVDNQELIRIALDLKVDEIVVPDDLLNTEESIRLMHNFEPIATRFPQFRYMGVVQAADIAHAHKCIMAYAYKSYISVLGLPRSLSYIHRWQRALLAEAVTEGLDVGAAFDAIHCLGMHSWLREPAALCDIPLVRGMDTSTPIYMGLEGLSIIDDEYIVRPHDYFDRKMDGNEVRVFDNIRAILEWSAAPKRGL